MIYAFIRFRCDDYLSRDLSFYLFILAITFHMTYLSTWVHSRFLMRFVLLDLYFYVYVL